MLSSGSFSLQKRFSYPFRIWTDLGTLSYTALLELGIREICEVVFDTWPRGEEEIYLVLARLKFHPLDLLNVLFFVGG